MKLQREILAQKSEQSKIELSLIFNLEAKTMLFMYILLFWHKCNEWLALYDLGHPGCICIGMCTDVGYSAQWPQARSNNT